MTEENYGPPITKQFENQNITEVMTQISAWLGECGKNIKIIERGFISANGRYEEFKGIFITYREKANNGNSGGQRVLKALS